MLARDVLDERVDLFGISDVARDEGLAGAEFVRLDVASFNPVTMLRCALALSRIVREKRCDLIHAHGRAAAWSGYIAARARRVPLLTTWYKGFREQNALKRLYNGNRRSNPQAMCLISWNEITEGTYIEPLRRYGDGYVKRTARL